MGLCWVFHCSLSAAVSDLSSPPSRCVACGRVLLFSAATLGADQLLLPLPLVEPISPQPDVAALVFRWERSVNGLPERGWDLFPCFLVTTLGPDPANSLAQEKSKLLMQPSESSPAPPTLKHLLLDCRNCPSFSFSPLMCQIMPRTLENLPETSPRCCIFYLMECYSPQNRSVFLGWRGGYL